MRRWIAVLTVCLLAWLAAAPPALAHTGPAPTPGEAWTAWDWSLGLWLALALSAWVYARGWLALEAHQRRPGGWQTACFAGALLLLFVALLSPLDALSSALLSVHMLQHVLLMLGVAPLMALSRPLGPLLLGLPRRLNQWLGRSWRRAGWLRGAWGVLSHPLAAGALQVVGLWLWHLPGAYQAALTNQWVHDAEHLTYVGTSLLIWWWMLQPAGHHAGHLGAGFVSMAVMTLASAALALLLLTAAQPWYPAYAGSSAAWGLSALQDQQWAGGFMLFASTAAGLAMLASLLAGKRRQFGLLMPGQPIWQRPSEKPSPRHT